jgi:8-amino-7-oxononanoate synthase
VGAAEAALKILRVAKEERRYLQEISGSFRRILKIKEREKILYPSPIVPVIIGDPVKTIELRNTLLQHGILVGAIRPPTVQPHTSRLRISLHTGVKQETLEMLGDLLLQWIKS